MFLVKTSNALPGPIYELGKLGVCSGNNESSEVFDIIKPGRRVRIKCHRQYNVNNLWRFVIRVRSGTKKEYVIKWRKQIRHTRRPIKCVSYLFIIYSFKFYWSMCSVAHWPIENRVVSDQKSERPNSPEILGCSLQSVFTHGV